MKLTKHERDAAAYINGVLAATLSKPVKLPKISEAEFTAQVLAFAKLHGWRSAHFRPARTAKGWRTAVQGDGAGFPDLLLLRNGVAIVMELKVGKNKASDEQGAWLNAFAMAGIQAMICYPADWPEIERTLSKE